MKNDIELNKEQHEVIEKATIIPKKRIFGIVAVLAIIEFLIRAGSIIFFIFSILYLITVFTKSRQFTLSFVNKILIFNNFDLIIISIDSVEQRDQVKAYAEDLWKNNSMKEEL